MSVIHILEFIKDWNLRAKNLCDSFEKSGEKLMKVAAARTESRRRLEKYAKYFFLQGILMLTWCLIEL